MFDFRSDLSGHYRLGPDGVQNWFINLNQEVKQKKKKKKKVKFQKIRREDLRKKN